MMMMMMIYNPPPNYKLFVLVVMPHLPSLLQFIHFSLVDGDLPGGAAFHKPQPQFTLQPSAIIY